ncbi:MAG: hypothetical protein AMJ46_14200 [Latescibacteria bacterium DG_63]|nr:MAG: hypothetical protein AMJ46_14200 [Latescibacteria bacterium DG_63]
MRRKTFGLFFLLSLLVPVLCLGYTIRDVLEDENRSPISGAYVKAYNRFTGVLLDTDTTDVAGNYELSIPDYVNLVEIRVSNFIEGASWAEFPWNENYGFRYLRGDSAWINEPRIAGLQSGQWKPSAGYMIPKGGMLSFRFDDYCDLCYPLVEEAEEHGFRVSILAVVGSGGWEETVGGIDYVRADSLRFRREFSRGDEILNHGCFNDDGWARGNSPESYGAKWDSATAVLENWLGTKPKSCIWPGRSGNTMIFNDTVLSVLQPRYRFCTEHNRYGVPPLSKWRWVNVSGTNAKHQWSHHPLNMPHYCDEYTSLQGMLAYVATSLARNEWVTVFSHCWQDSNRTKIERIMEWADSLGIPVLPITEAAELYYFGDFETHKNIFISNPFSRDWDGDGVPDILHNASTLQSLEYTGHFEQVPDYSVPNGTQDCVMYVPDGDGTNDYIVTGGVRPGAEYKASLYLKSHEADPDLSDTLQVAIIQMDAVGQLLTQSSYTFIAADTNWHYVSPSNWTITPTDTTEFLGWRFYDNTYPANPSGIDSFLVTGVNIHETDPEDYSADY